MDGFADEELDVERCPLCVKLSLIRECKGVGAVWVLSKSEQISVSNEISALVV